MMYIRPARALFHQFYSPASQNFYGAWDDDGDNEDMPESTINDTHQFSQFDILFKRKQRIDTFRLCPEATSAALQY